jgi:hypothetical protein
MEISSCYFVYSNISTFLVDGNPTESGNLTLTMIHQGALAGAVMWLSLGERSLASSASLSWLSGLYVVRRDLAALTRMFEEKLT